MRLLSLVFFTSKNLLCFKWCRVGEEYQHGEKYRHIAKPPNVSGHSSFFARTKINSDANVSDSSKIISFIKMLFARPILPLVIKIPWVILVEILSSLNGRIDKFSGGAHATPVRIIFKS